MIDEKNRCDPAPTCQKRSGDGSATSGRDRVSIPRRTFVRPCRSIEFYIPLRFTFGPQERRTDPAPFDHIGDRFERGRAVYKTDRCPTADRSTGRFAIVSKVHGDEDPHTRPSRWRKLAAEFTGRMRCGQGRGQDLQTSSRLSPAYATRGGGVGRLT